MLAPGRYRSRFCTSAFLICCQHHSSVRDSCRPSTVALRNLIHYLRFTIHDLRIQAGPTRSRWFTIRSSPVRFERSRLKEASRMPQTKCRILCIDDHKDASEMMKLLLSQEDYEVVTAETTKEAIELAKASEFDLYVLDRHLPDGSGLELCQQLTQITPGVPCIFYSGDAYDIHRSEALAAGADAYIAKPDIDRLIESVRQLLSERECAAASCDFVVGRRTRFHFSARPNSIA